MHLSLPAPHLPALHVPALHLTGRLPVATALLAVVYAAAVVIALTAPGQHALAGCVVLGGLVSRSVVRRRRSTVAAVTATTAAVDALAPDAVLADRPAPAPAAAA
ncbi:hypothetical protein [Modestobacter versicolor]|uniref:hypothetical protein n=1 Tax=Modestobacter versicolor TaxID=429133 RepID=UPI0034DE1578